MTLAQGVKSILLEDGNLLLDDLPFRAGQVGEVIVLPIMHPLPSNSALQRTVLRYEEPTAPVTEADWGALR